MSSPEDARDQPVIGFRVWRVDGEDLVAVGGERWAVGDNVAACRRNLQHAPPDSACGCGIYALHEPIDQAIWPGHVIGAVVAWGSLQVHLDGFRAQYARPIAIAVGSCAEREALAPLTRRYGLTTVEPRQLEALASEFGRPVPPAYRPAQDSALLGRVTSSIARREQVRATWDPIELASDRFVDRYIGLAVERPHDGLIDSIRETFESGRGVRADSRVWQDGLSVLRDTTTDAVRDHDPTRSPVTLGVLLATLDASHGLTVQVLDELLSSSRSSQLPDTYAFHASILPRRNPATIQRARALLANDERWFPLGCCDALLVLLDELSDVELRTHLPRTRGSAPIGRALDRLGDRAPSIALAILRDGNAMVISKAAELLGRRARPLLLSMLTRHPWCFRQEVAHVAREIVGDHALRLAADRELREASDPVDTICALAILPGDEARTPLNRALSRVNRLIHDEPKHRVYERAWNITCSLGLAQRLEPGLIEHALADNGLGSVNHALILRAHPDAAPERAAELWTNGNLTARFALDVLRATGPQLQALAHDALVAADQAVTDRRAGPRLAAALAASPKSPIRDAVACAAAADRSFPATVRAVAAWTNGQRTADDCPRLPEDPAFDRYRTWLCHRATTVSDPLIDLLSGAWLQNTLVSGAAPLISK